MKYYVVYVEGCTPKIKEVKSKSALTNFLNSFKKRYGSLDDRGDNWVDYVFHGKRIKIEQTIKLVNEI